MIRRSVMSDPRYQTPAYYADLAESLLATKKYEWCRETLVGIAETIRRTNAVTLRQREAIEHIIVGKLKHDAYHHE